MKRLIMPLFLLTSFVAGAQNIASELHLNDHFYYKTKRPKKIIETDISFSNIKLTSGSVKEFDDAGMLVTEERYDENHHTRTAVLHYINDTARRLVLSVQMEQVVAGMHLTHTTYYKYDANNFLTGIEEKRGDVTINTTSIKNNEKGNPVELYNTDVNGGTYGKEYATYLYNNNQAIITVVNKDGETVSTDTMKISYHDQYKFPQNYETFNDKGDILSYRERKPNGQYDYYVCEYKYDKFGNCTHEDDYIMTVDAYNKVYKMPERSYIRHYYY